MFPCVCVDTGYREQSPVRLSRAASSVCVFACVCLGVLGINLSTESVCVCVCKCVNVCFFCVCVFVCVRARGAESSYRMMQGFLSLKGFSEVGTPTSRGSLRACCSQ